MAIPFQPLFSQDISDWYNICFCCYLLISFAYLTGANLRMLRYCLGIILKDNKINEEITA